MTVLVDVAEADQFGRSEEVRCEHRKDGTAGDPFTSCGDRASAYVHFAELGVGVPMCTRHTHATINDVALDAHAEDLP